MLRKIVVLALLGLSLVFSTACRTRASKGQVNQVISDTADPMAQKMVSLLDANCANGGCHGAGADQKLPETELKKFAVQTESVSNCLSAAETAADAKAAKVACFRQGVGGWKYSIGLYRAAVGPNESDWETVNLTKLVLSANLSAVEVKAFQRLYMPLGTTVTPELRPNVLAGAEYTFAQVLAWFAAQPSRDFQGIANARANPAIPDAVPCEDKLSPALVAHVKAGQGPNAKTWRQYHTKTENTPMFGCNEPGGDAKSCLQSFPEHNEWKNQAEPTTFKLRELRKMDGFTSFWTRSSPDGRWVGNGGYRAIGPNAEPKGKGSMDDLLTPDRRVALQNSYFDPAFSPDNKYFMFVDALCPIAAIQAPNVNSLDTLEAPCTTIEEVDTYQSMGAKAYDSGDNFVVVYPGSGYVADNGASDRTGNFDATEFSDAEVNIKLLSRDGTGALSTNTLFVPLKAESQSLLSASSKLIVGRFGPREARDGRPAIGHTGYHLHFLDRMVERNKDYDTDAELGPGGSVSTLCLKGNKAMLSYDDRYLVTHHFTEAAEDTTKAGASSDIYLYDLLQQKSYKLTNMPWGSFALYPHFRADGWLYFLVRDWQGREGNIRNDYIMATDFALQKD